MKAKKARPATLEELQEELLHGSPVEWISYVFALVFAAASVSLIARAVISHEPFAAIPATLLMMGFRSSMGFARRTRMQIVLLLTVFVEAIRPDLARPLSEVRGQILSEPRPKIGVHRTSVLNKATELDLFGGGWEAGYNHEVWGAAADGTSNRTSSPPPD